MADARGGGAAWWNRCGGYSDLEQPPGAGPAFSMGGVNWRGRRGWTWWCWIFALDRGQRRLLRTIRLIGDCLEGPLGAGPSAGPGNFICYVVFLYLLSEEREAVGDLVAGVFPSCLGPWPRQRRLWVVALEWRPGWAGSTLAPARIPPSARCRQPARTPLEQCRAARAGANPGAQIEAHRRRLGGGFHGATANLPLPSPGGCLPGDPASPRALGQLDVHPWPSTGIGHGTLWPRLARAAWPPLPWWKRRRPSLHWPLDGRGKLGAALAKAGWPW